MNQRTERKAQTDNARKAWFQKIEKLIVNI